MAKIKSVSKVQSTTSTRKTNKNPILKHTLQTKPLDKTLAKKQETKITPLTIREHNKAIKLYMKHYSSGVTVKNALDHSLPIDIERAKTQLRAFYIRTLAGGTFKFVVKASGLYAATSHEVHIKWEIDNYDLNKNPKDIFLNAPIKAQCSCGRHTYYYRYLWTVARSSLGLQEHRYPEVRNKDLDGMCCKHMIRVMKAIHAAPFQQTFGRYIENEKANKKTKISQKDKARIAGGSFSS